MMVPYNAKFGTIVIKPSVKQWLCCEWVLILLNLISYVVLSMSPYSPVILILPAIISLHLMYQLLFLRKMQFTVGDEMLIYEYGVFTKRLEYIELYRVIDFHETIGFLQNLLGIKTVVIYSGDRTTPKLPIPGINQDYPLVPTIRERVEATKQRKRIYEFTNR